MQLSAVPWRCVVIDEAHRLKNRNCKLLEGLNNLSMVYKNITSFVSDLITDLAYVVII